MAGSVDVPAKWDTGDENRAFFGLKTREVVYHQLPHTFSNHYVPAAPYKRSGTINTSSVPVIYSPVKSSAKLGKGTFATAFRVTRHYDVSTKKFSGVAVEEEALRVTRDEDDFLKTFEFSFLVISELRHQSSFSSAAAAANQSIVVGQSPFLQPLRDAFRSDYFPGTKDGFPPDWQPIHQKEAPFYCTTSALATAGTLRELLITTTATTVNWLWPSRTFATFQLLQAYAALHAVGFVHRDLKPTNVLVNRLESSESPADFIRQNNKDDKTDWIRRVFDVTGADGAQVFFAPAADARLLSSSSLLFELWPSDAGISEHVDPRTNIEYERVSGLDTRRSRRCRAAIWRR